jgi:hypothetical protein
VTDDGKQQTSAAATTWAAAGLGMVTFVVGVVLLIMVFQWAYTVFQGIDSSFDKVAVTTRVASPGSAARSGGANASLSKPTVVAQPGSHGLLQTVAVTGTKLIGLLILGWIAAMIAARGAGMVAASLTRKLPL